MKQYAAVVLAVAAASAFFGGCSNKSSHDEVSDKNLVTLGATVPKDIGDENHTFTVIPKNALGATLKPSAASAQVLGVEVADVETPAPKQDEETPNPLLLGVPIDVLGQENVFGAVITKVSDVTNDTLGSLKLTDLAPLHVIPKVGKTDDGTILLALFGCVQKCTKDNLTDLLVTFPVVGFDEEKKLVVVDLSSVGAEYDLMAMLDPGGDYTKLKTKVARTTAVDYSQSTLVFDVESHMVPVKPNEGEEDLETVFTVRWYMRLNTDADPAFASRSAVDGVGYFKTERGAETRITRFSTDAGPVKYYVKNVPAEYQPAFAAAFDAWNKEMRALVGKDLLAYEFVNADDERAKLLVPGDIRYKIVEWDLVNKATYGGLGPSIANQLTGQTISANVLIQGPRILVLYKAWFEAASFAKTLAEIGMADEAETVLLKAKSDLMAATQPMKAKFALTLGKKLAFRVVAQLPELEDPVMQRDDFDAIPEGQTFESYMPGYFEEMLTHELGHNLGLRHNFKGNLGAEGDAPALGRVSRSVMDYLSRGDRFLDRIGEYDRMAIAYGYTGAQPAHTDWFCTDEDGAAANKPGNSAECTKDDGSNDPFSYFEKRLARGVNMLLNRGKASAPVWSVEDMASQLQSAIGGLASYASSAEKTSVGWLAFYGKPGRPERGDAAAVKAYVAQQLKAQLCDASFAQEIETKDSDEAKAKTRANILALREKAAAIAASYKVFSAQDLACE